MYKRQVSANALSVAFLGERIGVSQVVGMALIGLGLLVIDCLLYTSDAADDLLCVDLGGRRIIKKKNLPTHPNSAHLQRHTKIAPCTHQSSITH